MSSLVAVPKLTRPFKRGALAWVGAIALMVCVVAAPAHADAADREREAAKALFRAATVHFEKGRFPEALTGFTQAYEKDPRAGFLFNIAQCHRQLGNHAQAVVFFERYLKEAPNAPNRALAADMLEDEKLMAAATPTTTTPTTTTPTTTTPTTTTPTTTATTTAADPSSASSNPSVDPAATPAAGDDEPLYNRVEFWGIVGGAALVAVVGTVVVVAASNRSLGVVDLRGVE